MIPGWQRAIIVLIAALLWMQLAPLPRPSERFHLMLPPLWAAAFWIRNKRPDGRTIAYATGIGLGILFYLIFGNAQAAQIGARFTLGEAFYSLYFTAGLFAVYSGLCAVIAAPLRWNPRTAALLNAPRGWWLRLLRMAIAMLIFAPYLYTAFNIHRFKYVNITDPQHACGLAFENVAFQAKDGTPLQGWFVPAPHSDKAVLLVHGLSANRGDMLSMTPFLHRAGFNVFMFDLRGHGDSGGHTTSFGYYEGQDVLAAGNYLALRKGIRHVAIYAFSMGGAAAMNANFFDRQAMILDSTFGEFEPLVRAQMAFLPDKVAYPLLKVLAFYTKLEIGVGIRDIVSPNIIPSLNLFGPLLIIHGTADTLIPPSQARYLYNAVKGSNPKDLYLIPGANHCQGFAVAGPAYEKRVVDFLRAAFRRNELYTEAEKEFRRREKARPHQDEQDSQPQIDAYWKRRADFMREFLRRHNVESTRNDTKPSGRAAEHVAVH